MSAMVSISVITIKNFILKPFFSSPSLSFFSSFPVGADPNRDLQFLYEGHEKFAALPAFDVIPAQVSRTKDRVLILHASSW